MRDAEATDKAIMGMEMGKEFCFPDLILDVMANASGIVEDQQTRDTADVFKHCL